MKNYSFYLIICILLAGSCKSGNENEGSTDSTVTGIMERLDVAHFQKKLAETTNPQLIDVRTPEEVANGTIQGSVNMDFHSANFEERINTLDKSRTIFVFCQSGGRSLKTAKKMQALGFKEIYELEPGYSGWEQ
jgi:rhodanese-related sulfurtransferase